MMNLLTQAELVQRLGQALSFEECQAVAGRGPVSGTLHRAVAVEGEPAQVIKLSATGHATVNLQENPQTKTICVVYDDSGSMHGSKIEAAKEAMCHLIDKIIDDDTLANESRLIVKRLSGEDFEWTKAELIERKGPIQTQIRANWMASCSTPLLPTLDRFPKDLDPDHTSMVIITDGEYNERAPTPEGQLNQVFGRIRAACESDEIPVFPLFIGQDTSEALASLIAERSNTPVSYISTRGKSPAALIDEFKGNVEQLMPYFHRVPGICVAEVTFKNGEVKYEYFRNVYHDKTAFKTTLLDGTDSDVTSVRFFNLKNQTVQEGQVDSLDGDEAQALVDSYVCLCLGELQLEEEALVRSGGMFAQTGGRGGVRFAAQTGGRGGGGLATQTDTSLMTSGSRLAAQADTSLMTGGSSPSTDKTQTVNKKGFKYAGMALLGILMCVAGAFLGGGINLSGMVGVTLGLSTASSAVMGMGSVASFVLGGLAAFAALVGVGIIVAIVNRCKRPPQGVAQAAFVDDSAEALLASQMGQGAQASGADLNPYEQLKVKAERLLNMNCRDETKDRVRLFVAGLENRAGAYARGEPVQALQGTEQDERRGHRTEQQQFTRGYK